MYYLKTTITFNKVLTECIQPEEYYEKEFCPVTQYTYGIKHSGSRDYGNYKECYFVYQYDDWMIKVYDSKLELYHKYKDKPIFNYPISSSFWRDFDIFDDLDGLFSLEVIEIYYKIRPFKRSKVFVKKNKNFNYVKKVVSKYINVINSCPLIMNKNNIIGYNSEKGLVYMITIDPIKGE